MAKISVDQALLKAKAHAQKGEIEDAKNLYQIVLQAFPQNEQAQQGLATLNKPKLSAAAEIPPQEIINQLINLYNQGQLAQVVEQAQMLTKQYPKASLIWNILGAANKGLGQLQTASEAFKKVTELNPKDAVGFNNFGTVLKAQGRLEEAIAFYEQALSLKPDYAEACNNMGTALKEQCKLEEAIACYEKALSLKPAFASAYYNMGIALKDQGKLEEAIASYEKALSLKPDYAEAYNNMGNALKEQCKLEEAIASYEKALSLKPDFADAYNNMGTALKDQGKLEEAIASYEKALSLKPAFAGAYNNMGRLHWLQGSLSTAFEFLEYRWLLKDSVIGEALKTKKPEWQGEKERLFVWKEQGIGDEIMFSSLLIEAEQQSSGLTVECDRRLIPIYKRSFPPQIKFIDDRKKVNEQDYDSHLAIGSLLKHFRSDKSDFEKSAAGWLKADETRINKYRNSLLSKPSSKLIGLSWFTKATKVNSHFRNIDLERLSDHLQGLSVDFVSLQYGLSKEELAELSSKLKINILSVDELDLFNDIDGLASLISACDIVISIDNINVHLAGALGVDTRVMLPKVSDERWGLASEQSYWYDSVKLYRQEKLGDWHGPLTALKEEFLS